MLLGEAVTTRWERLTATRGRAATVFGTLGLFVVIAVLLPQPFLLGLPSGTYVVIGLLIVWVTALAVIEASWKRQDRFHGN